MGQADYLPVLAAAEIDLLLGPSWPLRPGRALQLVLQELVATGRLRRAEGADPWPLVAAPGAEPPVRWMTASVHRLFLQDGGLSADGFVGRMATAFEDTLELSGGAPTGYPERWFSAALSTGLVAEGWSPWSSNRATWWGTRPSAHAPGWSSPRRDAGSPATSGRCNGDAGAPSGGRPSGPGRRTACRS